MGSGSRTGWSRSPVGSPRLSVEYSARPGKGKPPRPGQPREHADYSTDVLGPVERVISQALQARQLSQILWHSAFWWLARVQPTHPGQSWASPGQLVPVAQAGVHRAGFVAWAVHTWRAS